MIGQHIARGDRDELDWCRESDPKMKQIYAGDSHRQRLWRLGRFVLNKNVDLMPDVGHHCELIALTFAIRCS